MSGWKKLGSSRSGLKKSSRASRMPTPDSNAKDKELTYLVCKMLVDMIEGRQDTRLNVSAYRTVLFSKKNLKKITLKSSKNLRIFPPLWLLRLRYELVSWITDWCSVEELRGVECGFVSNTSYLLSYLCCSFWSWSS